MEPATLTKCRAVHLALVARANGAGMAPEEWAEQIGPDAFERIAAEECERMDLDFDAFNAWSADPDPLSEFEANTGAHAPTNPEEDETAMDEAIRALAKERHEREGDLEFDEGCVVSRGDDNGAYVACWKWVDFAGTPFDKEADTDGE